MDVLSLQADPVGFGTTTDPNKNGSTLYINDPRVGMRASGATVINKTGTVGGSINVIGNTGYAVLTDGNNNPLTSQNETVQPLTTGAECYFLVRAYYYDPTGQSSVTLASQSTGAPMSGTPTAVAPTFGGITGTSTPISPAGFAGVTVNWTPVVNNSTQQSLFSYYQIGAFTSQSATNFAALPAANVFQVGGISSSSYTTSGLNPNQTYYFRVIAVNNNVTPAISNGGGVVMSGVTKPQTPAGDSLISAAGSGPTSITFNYTAPSATNTNGSLTNNSTGGLYNYIFVWVANGNLNSAVGYMNAVTTNKTVAPLASNMATTQIAGTNLTLESALTTVGAYTGTLIAIPSSSIYPGVPTTYTLNGLAANQQVSVYAQAVYWVNGAANEYLYSTSTTSQGATPALACPNGWNGISSVAGQNTSADFSSLVVNWPAITLPPGVGTCEMYTSVSPNNTPNWQDAHLDCSNVVTTVGGLTGSSYYRKQVTAQVRFTMTAGSGLSATSLTCPSTAPSTAQRYLEPSPPPSGDGLTSSSNLARHQFPNAQDTVS